MNQYWSWGVTFIEIFGSVDSKHTYKYEECDIITTITSWLQHLPLAPVFESHHSRVGQGNNIIFMTI